MILVLLVLWLTIGLFITGTAVRFLQDGEFDKFAGWITTILWPATLFVFLLLVIIATEKLSPNTEGRAKSFPFRHLWNFPSWCFSGFKIKSE